MNLKRLSERFEDYYHGRDVVVTGADGFIGSHLVDALLECNARITIIVRGTSHNGCGQWNFRCLAHPPERFAAIIPCDIGSPECMEILARIPVGTLFHLAAIAYVNYSFDHPMEVFRANATGTLNILEGVRRSSTLQRIVVQSSSEVYGSRQGDSIAENHPLEPTSPYAASKLAAEKMALAYHKTYGLPVVVARPFNTYGPRHLYDVVPKFIDLALANRPLTIYGDGLQDRDFSYVEDTIQGLLALGSTPGKEGKTFNLGTGTSTTILELAKEILNQSGSRSIIQHVAPRAAEVSSLRANISRAKSELGFAPLVSLAEGLAANLEWARERKRT